MVVKDSETKELVPRLRFPEFRDCAPWDITPFGELFTIGSGRDYKHLGIGDVPVYGSGGYMLSVDEYLYEGESACIGRKGTINKPIFLSGKFWTVDTLFYTHSFKNSLPRFIFCTFQGINWLEHNEAGGVPSLSKANIEKILVPVPTLAEQKKISDCLFFLDDLIRAEIKKLELIVEQKSALMQRLFPREGETVPRLRFPEFQDADDWQKQKISALLTKSSSPVDVQPDESYREIGIRSHGKGIFHKEFVSGEALGDKRVFWVVKDALIVNIVFAWEQAVAVTSEKEHGMIASHRFPMFVAKPDKANVSFIKYFFLTKKGKELLGIASPGGAGRNKTLGQKEFENLEFRSPIDVAEQDKIAAFLTSLDELIFTQGLKIDAIKSHKKALMQQIFPAIDEEAG